MSMPWVQTVAAAAPAGGQTPYAADWMQSPFQASWSVEGLGGGVTGQYNIEATYDDINGGVTPEWFQVRSGQTVDDNGSITQPVMWIRINFTTGPVGGSVKFRVIQGMTAR